MPNKCPNCGSEQTKLVPAGTSKKTGKQYNAFYSCQECKKTWNLPAGQLGAPAAQQKIETEELYLLRNISGNLAAILEILEMKRDKTDPSEMGF